MIYNGNWYKGLSEGFDVILFSNVVNLCSICLPFSLCIIISLILFISNFLSLYICLFASLSASTYILNHLFAPSHEN